MILKLINKISFYIQYKIDKFIYKIFIPKFVHFIWKVKSQINKKRIQIISRDLSKNIKAFKRDGFLFYKLNNSLYKRVKNIENKLILEFGRLEYLSKINKNKFNDNRPEFKKYRVSLLNLINPIYIVGVLSSIELFCFLKGLNKEKTPYIDFIDIWLDGVNYESFRRPTETRLFHRDGSKDPHYHQAQSAERRKSAPISVSRLKQRSPTIHQSGAVALSQTLIEKLLPSHLINNLLNEFYKY